jgi:hypothetical protein
MWLDCMLIKVPHPFPSLDWFPSVFRRGAFPGSPSGWTGQDSSLLFVELLTETVVSSSTGAEEMPARRSSERRELLGEESCSPSALPLSSRPGDRRGRRASRSGGARLLPHETSLLLTVEDSGCLLTLPRNEGFDNLANFVFVHLLRA